MKKDAKNGANVLNKVIVLLFCLTFWGCPIVSLVQDSSVYSIKGEISVLLPNTNDTNNVNKIPSVTVKIVCENSYLSLPHETLSSIDGFFELKGRGGGGDCKLHFYHPEYKQKIIELDPDLRELPKGGLSWLWSVKVRLEPK